MNEEIHSTSAVTALAALPRNPPGSALTYPRLDAQPSLSYLEPVMQSLRAQDVENRVVSSSKQAGPRGWRGEEWFAAMVITD